MSLWKIHAPYKVQCRFNCLFERNARSSTPHDVFLELVLFPRVSADEQSLKRHPLSLQDASLYNRAFLYNRALQLL